MHIHTYIPAVFLEVGMYNIYIFMYVDGVETFPTRFRAQDTARPSSAHWRRDNPAGYIEVIFLMNFPDYRDIPSHPGTGTALQGNDSQETGVAPPTICDTTLKAGKEAGRASLNDSAAADSSFRLTRPFARRRHRPTATRKLVNSMIKYCWSWRKAILF